MDKILKKWQNLYMRKPLKRPQKGKRRWGLATRLEHRRIKGKQKRK